MARVPGPGTRDNPRDRRNRDRRSRSRPRKHTAPRPLANLGHPLDYARVIRTHGVREPPDRPVAIDVTPLLGAAHGYRRRGRGDPRRAAEARSRAPTSFRTRSARARAACATTCRPTRASSRSPRACCCRRGRASTRPASIGGCARRRSCTRRTTSRRRAGCRRSSASTTARSSGTRSCARPRCARSCRSCAARSRAARPCTPTSEFVAERDRGDLRARAAHRGRLVVIPLGVPALGTDGGDAAGASTRSSAARPFVLAIGTLEPRKNLPHLVAAFGRSPATHPDLRLVIAGHDGPARPRCRRRDRRASRRDAARPGRARRARSATRVAARCSTGRAARVPVDLRRLRLPGARGDDASACRSSPRARARSRRSRATRRCSSKPTDERALADAIDRVAHRRQRRARELVARGHDRVAHVLVGRHRASARRRATASCAATSRRASAMKVACTPASCCSPSRAASAATSASAPRALPDRGCRARRVRRRRSPPQRRRAVPWIDLGRPHGSMRYELWHRLAPTRSCASTPTSCTHRASRYRPCAARRSS